MNVFVLSCDVRGDWEINTTCINPVFLSFYFCFQLSRFEVQLGYLVFFCVMALHFSSIFPYISEATLGRITGSFIFSP